MEQDGEHRASGAVGHRVADGPGHALDHRSHRLQMAGVGGERELHVVAARRLVLADRAEVVLDVARALGAGRVELALELAEDLRVRLADHVGEHVQTAPVRHAEHDVAHARVARARAERVEHGHERLRPFEAEALLPQVLRVQEPLERLGRVEPLEDAVLLLRRHRFLGALDPLLDPLLLVGLLDVHVLDADGARVRVAQDAEDVAQRQHLARQAADTEVADRELAVEVPDGEVVVRDVELGVRLGRATPERVEVGDEVPADAVHVDERVDLHDLLVLGGRVGEPAAVLVPAGGLVRHRQAGEHVVVELVLPEQQLVDAPQELPALGAGDDPVVVGVGERGHLAHRELRQCGGVGALELGGVPDAADADDEALAGHQAGHRVHRADHARVGDGRRGTGEVVG